MKDLKKKRKRRNKRIERDKEKQVDSDPDLVTGVQGATTKRNPPNKIESRHKSMYLMKEGGEKEEEERIQDQEDRVEKWSGERGNGEQQDEEKGGK